MRIVHTTPMMIVHRRFLTLEAPNIEARLQLAALFAATGSELPKARSQRTGGEVTLRLLRQCWIDSPFSKEEHAQLRSVCRYSILDISDSLGIGYTWYTHMLGATVEYCA